VALPRTRIKGSCSSLLAGGGGKPPYQFLTNRRGVFAVLSSGLRTGGGGARLSGLTQLEREHEARHRSLSTERSQGGEGRERTYLKKGVQEIEK